MSTLADFLGRNRSASNPTKETKPAVIATPPLSTMPDSRFVIEARRLFALTERLQPVAIAPHPRKSNWPIEFIQLFARADRVELEAKVWGDADDQAAVKAARVAVDTLRDTWLAARVVEAPVIPRVESVREPAEDYGEHTAGRPHVGSLVHRFDSSNGKCVPAFVDLIHGGAPSVGVVVTAENPYVRLVDAGGGSRLHARWIGQPVKDVQPGMPGSGVNSWHRQTGECPR